LQPISRNLEKALAQLGIFRLAGKPNAIFGKILELSGRWRHGPSPSVSQKVGIGIAR
jgi:hypothetical protein